MVTPIVGNTQARCLIVSANRVTTPYPVYPLGAACLVGALKNRGHDAYHFDLLADGGLQELTEVLTGSQFDIIGISIRNLDSVDSASPREFIPDVVETVKCIRQMVDCPLVIGGPAFSIMPEVLLDLLEADYGIVGEGEELLPWLVEQVAAGSPPQEKLFFSKPVKGIWQPADLSGSTAKYYLKYGGMLNVQTKRGCPYTCSYCSYPNIEGTTIRYRDPDEVAAEVLHLQEKCGAKYIFFADSYFNDHEGRYLEVAKALIRRGSTLPWCAFFRPDSNLGKAELRFLKQSGLAAIELGTDATTDQTLAGISKSFTFSDVLQLHQNIIEEDIPCAHYVMFGGPEEDDQTLKAGLKNLDLLERSVVFAFVGIRILPDTGIYTRAISDGLIEPDQSLLEPIFYFSPKVSREKIETSIRSSFDNRLDRIYPCHEFEQRITMLHELGCVGPLWDLILKKRSR